jgi:hypothetical protein
VPDGYILVQPRTVGNWLFFRTFLVDGDPKPGVDLVKQHMKVYPLSRATNPTPMKFVDVSGQYFNTVAPADYSFWEMLDQVVQEEPAESLDEVRLGFYASVGLEKGTPFAPDERMRAILTEAAAVGDASARAITYRTRQKAAYYYENSGWKRLFVGGYKFELQPGVLNLDGYDQFFFYATGVTPAMEEKMVGPRVAICLDGNGLHERSARRKQLLQTASAAQHSSQRVLVRPLLQRSDAFDDSD